MNLALLPLMLLMFTPVPSREVAPDDVCAVAPRGIGDDAATKCKRKCNSQCSGAKNKSKCVAECRRACDR
ncbi:MAG: hypothetical protein Q8N26_28630 [Myxococcales bacterium]|nr:hypothetical protein [Myxococcales bacterium]